MQKPKHRRCILETWWLQLYYTRSIFCFYRVAIKIKCTNKIYNGLFQYLRLFYCFSQNMFYCFCALFAGFRTPEQQGYIENQYFKIIQGKFAIYLCDFHFHIVDSIV